MFLNTAVAKLKTVPQTQVVWSSSVYETDPVGNANQARFLNAVVEIETTLRPDELILYVKQVEQETGRTSRERWAPREIDIDILLYDGLVYAGETLQVPHPELEHRRFVLVPFTEIAPDVVHPVSGLTMEELSHHLRDGNRVVKTSYKIRI